MKQKEVTELFSELLKIREEILNSIPVAITGFDLKAIHIITM